MVKKPLFDYRMASYTSEKSSGQKGGDDSKERLFDRCGGGGGIGEVTIQGVQGL